jgi:hypothetical protein
MSLERFLPRPVKRVLGTGALVLAVGACGGQPVPSSSVDNRSSAPILTPAVTLEPTLKPTAELTLEPTSSPSPTQEPVFIDCSYCFWMPDLPPPPSENPDLPPPPSEYPNLNKPTQIKDWACGEGLLPNAIDIFSSGCAGTNNIFLMGHAYGVFWQLRYAYNHSLLKDRAIAYYTDGSGEEHAYQLDWVDHPTEAEAGKGSSWAATPTPVITLYTCDDYTQTANGKDTVLARDAYRIVVRLVPTQIPVIAPTETHK